MEGEWEGGREGEREANLINLYPCFFRSPWSESVNRARMPATRNANFIHHWQRLDKCTTTLLKWKTNYVFVYIYIKSYACLCVCVCACTCVCMSVCICICMSVCACKHLNYYVNKCMPTRKCVYIIILNMQV